MSDVRDVVLLHGWGANAAVWKDLAPRLVPRYRPHVPELPGYGSAPPCSPCTLDAIAAAVAQAAPARCHVIGWSLGGQVALAWARRAPRQVDRLALIAATPCFARRPDWSHAIEAEVLSGFARELAENSSGALKRFVSLQAQGDEDPRRVARQLRAALSAGGEPGAAALDCGLRVLLEADLRGELRSIMNHTLLLHGERDQLVPAAAAEYLDRRLPSARLALVKGAAHAPFVSQPQEVAAALLDFLDE